MRCCVGSPPAADTDESDCVRGKFDYVNLRNQAWEPSVMSVGRIWFIWAATVRPMIGSHVPVMVRAPLGVVLYAIAGVAGWLSSPKLRC